MNVHLIRTKGVDDELFYAVAAFLQSIPGPYMFHTPREPREPDIAEEIRLILPDDERYMRQERAVLCEMTLDYSSEPIRALSWDALFDICRKHRIKKKISEEDTVILLTDYGNHPNWFTGYDEQARNFFIHTEHWEMYTEGDSRYPIAYQVVSLLLKQMMFSRPSEMLASVHKHSKGCMMDFCEDKREIVLKLRTADICADCQKIVQHRNVPHAVLRYTLALFDDIRRQLLYRERYGMLRQESRLMVKGWNRKLYLPDLGMLPVNLSPTERAVYLLFLNHPEGIPVSHLSDYRAELIALMGRMSRRDDPQVIEQGVDELCRPLSNALSEKMSKIRRKFVDLLGEELADSYCIKGPNGGRKSIALPRVLVVHED
ncbi:MAG: hypothetical protein ACK5CT_02875 [Bacteroidota bacterium]